jgi:aspartyl-tRNA(Asn)/glutamyl-tRNA(Gln) amidotransferase subunit C
MAPPSTTVTAADVRRAAHLAHLALTDDEVEQLVPELAAVLALAEQLGALDLDGVPPTSAVELDTHSHDGVAHARADEPRPSLPVHLALAEAPRAEQGGFAVPAFVEEG